MAEKKKLSEKVDKRYRASVTVYGQKVWVSALTKKQLEEKKMRIRKQLRDGYDPNDDIPFVQVIQAWYDAMKLPNFKSPNTQREYEAILRTHIYPKINRLKMCKSVTHGDLQTILSSMRGYNSVSINLVKGILTHSCRYAVANGFMEHDPSTALVKPVYGEKKQRDALTDNQIDRLIDVSFEAGREGLVFFILYFLGLRINEAAALTWGDIDWRNDVVHITKALRRDINNRIQVSGTKTKSGIRDVPLPTILKDILRPYRQLQNVYILHDENGKPLFGSTFQKVFDNLLSKAGLIWYNEKYTKYLADKAAGKNLPKMTPQYIRSITAHWLRHNYVTMMFDADIPPEVASRFAGHSSYAITADIYTHIREQRKRKESVKLDGMFSKNIAKRLPKEDFIAK